MGKPVPSFWWDFNDDSTAIIVQSDYPGGDNLGVFKFGHGVDPIKDAEILIDDFKSGRKTPKWNRN